MLQCSTKLIDKRFAENFQPKMDKEGMQNLHALSVRRHIGVIHAGEPIWPDIVQKQDSATLRSKKSLKTWILFEARISSG